MSDNTCSGRCFRKENGVGCTVCQERRNRLDLATSNAKAVLKKGDRVRVKKCPGTKRIISFSHWDGQWMVSKSGINDYHAINVDMVNCELVDFGK
jgi:hypothetical protein